MRAVGLLGLGRHRRSSDEGYAVGEQAGKVACRLTLLTSQEFIGADSI